MGKKYLKKQPEFNYYKSKKILILFFFFGFNLVIAQNFINGDFEANIGGSTTPVNWISISGSPDIGNISDPAAAFAQTFSNPTPSTQGGNFLMIYDNGGGTTESVEQSISGFTIGNSYTITYQEAVLGARNNYDDNGELVINVSGISGDFTSGNILTVGAGWQNGQISFLATQTVHSIRLTAKDVESGGPGSWMSIDNIVVTNTLSIEDITIDAKIVIYPNPMTDIATISFEKNVINDIKVSIYDVAGQRVFSSAPNIVNNKASLDLSNISSGIYLLKVITNNGFITKKIIIE